MPLRTDQFSHPFEIKLVCFVSPFSVESILEIIEGFRVHYYCREVVPCNFGAGVEGVMVNAPYTIINSLSGQLEIVFSARVCGQLEAMLVQGIWIIDVKGLEYFNHVPTLTSIH